MDNAELHEQDAKKWISNAMINRDLGPAECIEAAKVHALLALAAAISSRPADSSRAATPARPRP